MNLLLVEDEAGVADFIRRGLKAEGWTVTVTMNGETALELLAQKDFDIVLLDLVLPGLDGLGVLKTLRDTGNSIPVLVLTALSTDDERLPIVSKLGANSISKPFDFDLLIARLKSTVAGAVNY